MKTLIEIEHDGKLPSGCAAEIRLTEPGGEVIMLYGRILPSGQNIDEAVSWMQKDGSLHTTKESAFFRGSKGVRPLYLHPPTSAAVQDKDDGVSIVPLTVGDIVLRSRVADLCHLLEFSTITAPSPGDVEQALIAMRDIRNILNKKEPK